MNTTTQGTGDSLPRWYAEAKLVDSDQGRTIVTATPSGQNVTIGRIVQGSFQPSAASTLIGFGPALLRDLADKIEDEWTL